MSNNLKSKAKTAFIWDFFGKLSITLSGFIISIFLARLLDVSDFGLVAIAMTIIGLSWSFSDMGLNGALIQRKRVLSIHYSSVFYFNIIIASILTITTYLLAPIIASFYGDDRLVLIIEVISIYFILSSLTSIHMSILIRELRFKELAQISFFSSIISGILGVILAFNDFGVWSLIFQHLISHIISILLIYKVTQYKLELKFSIKALKQLWSFGFRMFLSSILDNVFNRIDLMIIGKIFNPTILGFFQRAKSLDTMIVTYSSGSIMSVLFPILSKIKNDLARFQRVVIKALNLISFISFFLSGLFFLISNELIIILFGDKWITSVGFFQILVLVSFVYPISSLLVNVLSSRGNSKAFLRLEIYKKIVLSINLSIGFIWGIYGYLYGLVIAYIIILYLNIYFASQEIKLSKIEFIKPILIQAIFTAIITYFLFFLNSYMEYSLLVSMITKTIEFIILYILINWLFNVKSFHYFTQEIKSLINIKKA